MIKAYILMILTLLIHVKYMVSIFNSLIISRAVDIEVEINS